MPLTDFFEWSWRRHEAGYRRLAVEPRTTPPKSRTPAEAYRFFLAAQAIDDSQYGSPAPAKD